ncbi:MAG: hypothetical protein U5O39_12835 [Gammaproteobacteria bacterium]|nr:hypothetical protein [Gammaproteobacteria bacterium]
MASLPDRIIELHEILAASEIQHAFGGALALAWCTQRARGTIDIDINIFVPADRGDEILGLLPEDVKITKRDRQLLKRDGQVRIWWDKTPLDLFLNTTPYHDERPLSGYVEQRSWARKFRSCLARTSLSYEPFSDPRQGLRSASTK